MPEPLSHISFAAFVITYERAGILLETIKKLQDQTLSPSYILVVDNSESRETETSIKGLDKQNIGYYRVGYNSGPAGAAKIGLEILTAQGYQWIYWGDDDNPPIQKNIFETLFKQLKKNDNEKEVGIFGGKGGQLDPWTGRIKTFSNSALLRSETIDVDMVPGGGTLLVNAEVVKKNILPDTKLFFGFEELDFCLRTQKAGFRVMVDTNSWLSENYILGFRDKEFKWKDSSFGKEDFLWRSYYSTRNLLYIFFKNGYFSAFSYLLLKSIVKSLAGFGYGFNYGRRNFTGQWQAIVHFLSGTYGRV